MSFSLSGRTSLKVLMVGLIAVTWGVLITGLNFATSTVFNAQAHTTMESNSRLLLSSLNWAVSPLLKVEDLGSIQRILENFGDEKQIATVRLVDGQGQVLASSRVSGSLCVLPELELRPLFSGERLMVSAWNSCGLIAAIPIRGAVFSRVNQSDVAAALVLGLDSAVYQTSFTGYRSLIVAISSIAVVLFGVVFFLFLTTKVFTPLEHFKQAAQSFRDGVYSARVPREKSTEMQAFAGVFNTMASEIATKESQLEGRVAERTSELRQALVRLDESRNAAIQQEKMATLGVLAAGIAHEINNPTGYILSNLRTMADHGEYLRLVLRAAMTLDAEVNSDTVRLTNSPALLDASRNFQDALQADDYEYVVRDIGLILSDSSKGAKRIQEIVRGLQSYARSDELKPIPCDLNELLCSSLRLVEAKLKYHATVSTSFGELPPIRVVPGRIEQVLVNLLTNAADAVPDNGNISLTTWSVQDSVFLEVADDGVGMDSETTKKIFEPFFTTKDVGKGTGLGLSISLNLVEELNGCLNVESEVGRGSKFTLRLPICAPKPQEALKERVR